MLSLIHFPDVKLLLFTEILHVIASLCLCWLCNCYYYFICLVVREHFFQIFLSLHNWWLCGTTEDPTTSIIDFVIRRKTRYVGFCFHRDTKSVISTHVELYRNALFLLFGEQIVVPLESDAQPICGTCVKVSEKLYWCLQSTLS